MEKGETINSQGTRLGFFVPPLTVQFVFLTLSLYHIRSPGSLRKGLLENNILVAGLVNLSFPFPQLPKSVDLPQIPISGSTFPFHTRTVKTLAAMLARLRTPPPHSPTTSHYLRLLPHASSRPEHPVRGRRFISSREPQGGLLTAGLPRQNLKSHSLRALSLTNTSGFPQPRSLSTTPATTTTSVTTSKVEVSPEMYTTSFAFFEALWDAGVTHVFVNLGSDHPSIIEAMVKGAREKKDAFPRIITCPNEMVAMSMADGFARLTNKPQAVIVHVDVGTQGLGAAMHNSSTGRAPVLIFAGLSPFTCEGELRGSRTEYIHWIQDVPDQKAIVAQYCRYAAELKTGVNVKQMVNRALQFAKSGPQGPVYLCGAREVMEMDLVPYSIRQGDWDPVELGGLPKQGAKLIAKALVEAKNPLVITGYAGRNHEVPGKLVELADKLPGLRVLDTGGSEMCFPADHPAWLGLRFGNEKFIEEADVIVVLDCDVPWIQTQCKPREDAKVFHIDVDPLKDMMPLFYVAAQKRYRADSLAAVEDVLGVLEGDQEVKSLLEGQTENRSSMGQSLKRSYQERLDVIEARSKPFDDGRFGTSHLCKKLRELCPEDTIWAIEAVTNTLFVHDSIRPTIPGSWINCGGGGLGWSGGGALGIKLATEHEAKLKGGKGKFVVQVVGDGTFLFSVPGSVYWIAKRYGIPVLTIVLNNKGWNAPRRSLLLVHPDGLGANATNEEINIAFNPSPDYAGIAKAAAGGDIFAARVDKADQLEAVLKQAIEAVEGGQAAVVDCKVELGC